MLGNIVSVVYYASVYSGILRFFRATSDSNIFITLSNKAGKISQIFMLNKKIEKYFNTFHVFTDTANNIIDFLHCVELEL